MSGLLAHLQERIRRQGPLSVADYMAECLYHPQWGYYLTHDPIGPAGDFITAPELTQAFGEVMGAWVIDTWHKLGQPQPWHLVELGPGYGTLMSDVLRILQRHAPQAYTSAQVALVEISPRLIARQRQTLNSHPQVQWHTSLTTLTPGPAIVLGNEFFDALPIQQFEQTPAGYRERLIDLTPTADFTFTLAPDITPLTATAPLVEICPAMPGLTKRLIELFPQSYCLFLDYGAEGTADTWQALAKHQFVSPLTRPGEVDLTAHVNFTALREAFSPRAWGYTDLAAWLLYLGYPVRAAQLLDAAKTPQERENIAQNTAKLLSPSGMGSLFKVACSYSPGLPTPAGFI